MISHFSITFSHFFPLFPHFVPLCTSFSSLRTVTVALLILPDPKLANDSGICPGPAKNSRAQGTRIFVGKDSGAPRKSLVSIPTKFAPACFSTPCTDASTDRCGRSRGIHIGRRQSPSLSGKAQPRQRRKRCGDPCLSNLIRQYRAMLRIQPERGLRDSFHTPDRPW